MGALNGSTELGFSMLNSDIFADLFVLEMTNNHLGRIERGIEIIQKHSEIVRLNEVRAAIKFQFRSLESFIHPEFLRRKDINYIKRVTESNLSKSDYAKLVEVVRENGCIPIATPFDEEAIKWCIEFDLPIVKVASVDSNDWSLLAKIADTKKPTIISTGGTPLSNIDDVVALFEKRDIPLALNHCISTYPNKTYEMELHQIDFLKNRYRDHIIGFSSHEQGDISSSIMIAYSKGARLFEKHIDIPNPHGETSPYSSFPDEIDAWFKAYHKTREICGTAFYERRIISAREQDYLNSHLRGVYAKVDLVKGQMVGKDDLYLAIPLQNGQLSTKDFNLESNSIKMKESCMRDKPISLDIVDVSFIQNKENHEFVKIKGI